MQTVEDILKRIQQENLTQSKLYNNSDIRTADEVLNAVKSGEVQQAVQNQAYTNSNDLGTLTGAFALGAGNMINDTALGGAGWVLGNLGRGIEYISPFSGRSNSTIDALLNAGHTLDEIEELYPNEDSWITSAAKGTLAAHNYVNDALSDWRKQLLGDNPTLAARIAEGSGSSIGFLLAGLGTAALASTPGVAGMIGALTSGGLESISEAGGFMGDAYRNGLYDKGALGTANKDFLANLALNTGLDYTVGAFNPYIRGIINPVTRGIATAAGETVNELLQEPSQQVIEQAALNSLKNNSDFLPNLWDSTMGNGDYQGKSWLDTLKQVGPEVFWSTMLTQALLGAGGVATKQGRKNFMFDWNRRNDKDLRNQDIIDNSNIYDTKNINSEKTGETTQAPVNFQNVTTNAPESSSGKQQTKFEIPVDDSLPKNNTKQNAPNVTPNNPDQQQLGFNIPVDDNQDNTQQTQTTQPVQTTPNLLPQPDSQTQTPPTAKTGSNITKIRTMEGTEVEARYRVIDADDLITSTTERGGLNPRYLAELQSRDRGTSASDSQVRSIANNLDPELLGESRLASDGAPVIGSDLMVESGNGRVMAIRAAYKYGKAEKYRQWIKDNASYFGIDPDYIDTINNPVLVRERITDVDRVKFTSEANESSIATMSTTEHALDDAKKITPEILTSYDSDKTLEENKTFLNWFVGAMPKNEQGDLKQKDGKISISGIDRARNALVVLAYNDAGILRRLSENYDDEVKNITDGLTVAAPKIAIFETGKHTKDLSIRKDILQALNVLADLRANKQSVPDYLAQILMFEEDEISPEAKMLLKFFDDNKRSYKKVAQGLIDYVNLAMDEPQEGQGLLFDDSRHSKAELLQQVLNSTIHSNEFINWFGDWQNSPKNASKVVDKNGVPLVVYHGTESKTGREPFSIFDMAGKGITKDTGAWFNSNKKAAKTFGNYVYQVYLDIKHPYIYTARDRVKDTKKMDQIVRDVKAGKHGEGYDGVIFRNVEDVMHYFDATPDELVGDVFVVFRPEQIKEISNKEFSKNNPDIHHQNIFLPESRLLQQVRQQIIDMGHPQYGQDGAEAIAQLFEARIRAFAKYADIDPDDYLRAKNFTFIYDKDPAGRNLDKRGRSEFIPEKRDADGNIIREAQSIIRDCTISCVRKKTGGIQLWNKRAKKR